MIEHHEALALGAAALDFALGDSDRADLQEHLDGCAACRVSDERIRAEARGIADLPSVDAPDRLRTRVLESAATLDAAQDVLSPRDEGGRHTRPIIPARHRRSVAVLLAAVALIALISGMLYWRSAPDDGHGVAAASPSPSGTPGSTTAIPLGDVGSPGADGAWSPIATLTADDVKGGVLALDSGFRLASLDGTPAAALAAHLAADPPVAFTVAADAGGTSARIRPTEPLTAGVAYRFRLIADDGRTLDSWAFQTHQPLHVVATVPGDSGSGVPTNTGIEVTFDQDGVTHAADHITIQPKVAGRFEQHGRTIAFVPAKRLAAATLYTVTIRAGVTVAGTSETLESDVRFRFETAAASAKGKLRTTFQFPDDVFESATADRPIIALWAFPESDERNTAPTPKTARIEVHRLAGVEAAIAAFDKVRAAPRWARQTAVGIVPTKGLTRVASLDAKLHELDGTLWFQLPKRLAAGFYLVTVRSGTRPVQTVLQVTDIAGYLVVTDTKTLVWANDVGTGRPVAGATVASDGVALGRTGIDGTGIVDTPARLKTGQGDPCTKSCSPVITVRSGGRAIFLPATGRSQYGEAGYGSDVGSAPAASYWTTVGTDRVIYRRTDTVNTWGLVRDRDTGAVPASVTVRLLATGGDGSSGDGAPLATSEVHPNAIGAFSGSIALDDLPEGSYTVEWSIAGELVDSRSIQVDRILKPAYRLAVETGRRVYFQGDQIKVTARATFYEGSPVPGVPLRVEGLVDDSFTTDETGTATARTTVQFESADQNTSSERDVRTVTVNPARAEEGEISGASREILAFPSTWTIGASATIVDGQVRVSGSLRAVDRDRLEREIAGGKNMWELDPAGAPMAGKTVTATFIEEIPQRVQTGTRYDFIEKTVVPVYEYRTIERAAGSAPITTAQDGTFLTSVSAGAAGNPYIVRLTATDPDDHVTRWGGWASGPAAQNQDFSPSLTLSADVSKSSDEFGVGEPIDLTMSDPHAAANKSSRYLFYTAQRGLRDVNVQSSAQYHGRFEEWAPPAMSISGIRFTGSGYVESPSFTAAIRTAERELSVGLTTDADRYDPGASVTLTVTTHDHTGRPVPATVVLRGVDEKLFTIAAAEAADPLGDLYADVGSGVLWTYRSHHEPGPNLDGGGDTTGGGGDEASSRSDFRDWVLFKTVDTGQDGRAVVTFPVSDDLTSWRVSASAFAPGPQAGEATIGIPVGLPFFVDATIAQEYLVSDQPAIGLRAYGTALDAAAQVTFAVDSESLGLHVTDLHAAAFETETVRIPKLSVGNHQVTITATTGDGGSARRDVLTRTFTVVPSRLATTRARYLEPTAGTHLEGGDGRVLVVVSDAGAARYLPILLSLTGVESARLERTLGAAIAGSLATDRFGLVGVVPTTTFDAATYQTADGGLSVLPYSSSNLEASALAALVAPARFDRDSLASYLSAIAGGAKQTRERRMFALAGLAGLHEPVLPLIREATATAGLTIRERLMLGLGAAALGDAATARSIGASLEAQYGEITSDHARLRVGDSAADITAGTALMAMLAAANGDPLAARFWSSVAEEPEIEAPYSLQAVGFVERMLERAAPGTASFAYTVAGKREVVELETGRTFQLSLSHEQFGSLTIESTKGQVGVTTSWRETVAPSAYSKDPDLTIERAMTPSGTIGTAALVRVDLNVTLGAKAPSGCHLVTDIAPSGLVPVGNLQGWVDPNDDRPAPKGVTYPYAQAGQRVSFCANRGKGETVVHLRYFARVVTGGTYTWEPAVLESRSRSGRAALTPAEVVTIR